ncbi:MAG TPA: LacI family DNA-binding transcriptional regulator [Daejeonella sp.]|nr:LacI family DNA-binding transcriptional regulator [Daejeonella sp.]
MEPVNLKTLAKQLNISVSTVSKALRDSYEIGAETKARVVALAKELNYHPNPYASSLRQQKSKTIAVVIPEIANNFFSLAINGIEEIAQEKGYHVLIYLTHEDYQKEVAIARHLASGRVDGVLMSLSSETANQDHLHELHAKKISIVFFDRVSESTEFSNVTTDDYESGLKATNHLIQQGCKNIAYLSVSRHLSIDKKRKEGYLAALSKHGIAATEENIVFCGNNNEENHEKIKQLLTSENRPDGIFASIEKLAIATYNICNELNLRIPQDVKVVGFSNLETAHILNPPLTVIRQPAYAIGREAATILFKTLNNKNYRDERVVLNADLVERTSTAK